MNQAQFDTNFGSTVFKSEDFLLKARVDDDGALRVYAFRIKEGHVQIPLGFMLGTNALHFDKAKEGTNEQQ